MWVLYAFASLFFLNLRTVVTKYNVSNTHEYVSMWYTFVFQIPLGILAVLTTGIQISDNSFFALVLIRAILDIVAFILFFKALKVSAISSVLPFMALHPAITVFTSFLINNQSIGLPKLLLILIIALTCYFLYRLNNSNSNDRLNNRKGLIYIGLVIAIYSVLDPLHAEILKISAPYTYFFISSIYFLVIWTSFVLIYCRKELVASFADKRTVGFNGLNGVILSLEVLSLFSALVPGSITSIVSAIRSTNVAVSSVLGGLLFKEKLEIRKLILIAIVAICVLLLILG